MSGKKEKRRRAEELMAAMGIPIRGDAMVVMAGDIPPELAPAIDTVLLGRWSGDGDYPAFVEKTTCDRCLMPCAIGPNTPRDPPKICHECVCELGNGMEDWSRQFARQKDRPQ